MALTSLLLDGFLEIRDKRPVLQTVQNAVHQFHQRRDLGHEATSIPPECVASGQLSLHLLPPGTADRFEVAQSFARLEGVTAMVVDVSVVAVRGGDPGAV